MIAWSVSIVLLASGCAPTGSERIRLDIEAELQGFEKLGSHVVDLDRLVPGKWTEVVIACYPNTSLESLNDALGFEWSDPPELDYPYFSAALIFSDGDEVESYYSGKGGFYWIPCPLATEDDLEHPIVIDRRESQLEFQFAKGTEPFWFLPSTYLDVIARKQ